METWTDRYKAAYPIDRGLPEPEVVQAAHVHESWKPLRFAPYLFYTDRSGCRGAERVDRLAKEAASVAKLQDCRVEWGGVTFMVMFPTPPDKNIDGFRVRTESFWLTLIPYEVRDQFSELQGDDEYIENFIRTFEILWDEMEEGLRLCSRRHECRILAKVGSPHAERFTEISADGFAVYAVTDWRNGIAQNRHDKNDRLYSIHVAKKKEISSIRVGSHQRDNSSEHGTAIEADKDIQHSSMISSLSRKRRVCTVISYFYSIDLNASFEKMAVDKNLLSLIGKFIAFHKLGSQNIDYKTVREAYEIYYELRRRRCSTASLESIGIRRFPIVRKE